jgi:hypothetical protein
VPIGQVTPWRPIGYHQGMFEELPDDDRPAVARGDPAERAAEKALECRMHAELAAVFEGPRKFGAELRPGLSMSVARHVQQSVGRLEKSRQPDSPLLPMAAVPLAAEMLLLPQTAGLTTSDYHIHRRPGEVMVVRWLAGEEVDTYYERLQAHFDAGIAGFIEDERQFEWKQDPWRQAHLAALQEVQVDMAERYLRKYIRENRIFVLSTQTADEMNIEYLCDQIMGVPVPELVGEASAPPQLPTDADLAWFFKLYALRGIVRNEELMCFFTFLQKTGDDFEAG